MATERISKERSHKQSADYSGQRIRTDMDEGRYSRQEVNSVEISVDELRELVGKLRALRGEK
jgi:hypothetical protein